MNAADTNVLVYAFDVDEIVKRPKAEALLDRLARQPESSVLLWQVASEFLNWLRKWEAAGRVSAADVEAQFRDVRAAFPLRLPGAASFGISFTLRSRYSLSHWDSLLIAACQDAGVTRLYSEDMQHGADYDGVTVVNPFI